MGTMIFLFIIPFSVMIVRFYSLHPGYAVVYHAQMQVFAALMLLVVFILGFFAVGPERNLSNPHHGIGVAIFVLFALQIVGGRLVRHITKSRSLRIMIHQWSGRAIALLGIVQVPLGLTLYGSPKYCFILYALWMSFLVLVYFILCYRQAGHRERIMMSGGRSEAGHSRLTESEYMSDHQEKKHGGIWKWLGPIAAIAGIWALMRKRKEHKQEREDQSYYDGSSRRHDAQDGYSRRDSYSYYDEKESNVHQQKKSGGGFLKILGGAAAAIGAGKLASNLMNRGNNKQREDEYSAVSTDTPRRHRPGRSEVSSDYYSDDYGRDRTELTRDSRTTGPTAPGASYRNDSRRDFMESDYSSYAGQSRRDDGKSGAMGKGLLAGLGMGWLATKFGKGKARRDEDRLREEEEMRAGNQGPRYTGDGHPSPTRRDSRRPPPKRTMGYPGESALSTDLSESTFDARTADTRPQPSSYGGGSTVPIPTPVTPTHGRTGSRRDTVAMPPMPSDPHGIFHSELDSSAISDARPQRRASSRRRAAGDKAAAAAAARASSLAADEEKTYRSERERYGSPTSQPVSVKLKVHDDRDRNVTLRRLTEEEAMAARRRRDSESSLSGLDSPSQGRGYRRGSDQRRAEMAAEQRVDPDRLPPLSPPNPAFARGKRAKDSAYYSGGQPSQPGPASSAQGSMPGSMPGADQTVSSLGTHESHGTWSGMSASPSGPDKGNESLAADNRRRRRQERRRAASSSRPTTAADMFD